MDRWKAEQGRGREKRKIRRKKMQMREKVGKSRNTVFFQWFVAPEGRKVGPLKWRVRSQLARWEMKNCITKHTSFGPLLEVAMSKSARRCGAKHILKSKCTKHTRFGPLLEVEMSKKCTPLWREAHFEVKNVQNTPGSDHFWKLRCRKSVRRCGAKHILKSKCTKHQMFEPLLEVRMLKKCTPLWREAHFEVKMYKTPHVRGCWKSARRCGAKHISKSKCTKRHMFAPLLEVRMLKKCTPLWREAHFEVKMYKTHVRATFGGSDVEKVHGRCGAKHISKSKCTKYSSVGPLLEVEMSKKCTPLWRQNVQTTRGSDHFWRFRCRFASRHNTTEHYATLHSSTLHYITLQYAPLH